MTNRKLNPGLMGGGKRKDMRVGPFVHSLEHGQVGDDSARVEVFETLVLRFRKGACLRKKQERQTVKTRWSPSETIFKSLSRGLTAPSQWVRKRNTPAARGRQTSDEIVVLDNELLEAVSLLVCAHHIGRPGPEQVVSQKHSNGPVHK